MDNTGSHAHKLGVSILLKQARGVDSTKIPKVECVRAIKGLALPRASHSSEIARVGSHRLRNTLAAAPALFAHVIFAVAKNKYNS